MNSKEWRTDDWKENELYKGLPEFMKPTYEAGASAMKKAVIEDLMRIIDSQAEDKGLWFISATASEAYLQQELRKLHAAIERKKSKEVTNE